MRLSHVVVYLVILFDLLVAGCGGATPAPTPLPNGQATVVVQGSPSQADWLALTERLADDRSPLVQNSQLMPAPPQVLVGVLPASLPFRLALPDQAVILGSVLRQGSSRGEALILLDVPQPAANINAFYQAALAQQGFSPWMPGAAQSFQPTSTALLFCQRDRHIQLELDVYEAPGQPSDVRLSYTTSPLLVSCNQDVPHGTTPAGAKLPTLTLRMVW